MRLSASIVTLGCRLNQADSALIAGRLERMGIELRPYSPEGTDVIIVNSCAVTATASRKSRQILRQFRTKHPDSVLVLTGCAADVDRENIAGIDGVDLILNNEGKKELERNLSRILREKGKIPVLPETMRSGSSDSERHLFSEKVFARYPYKSRANLKVQEGCDNFCSYCIVPYARGRERSRDFQETLDDFRRLLDAGFREITLTGVNICKYSCDGKNIIDLLEKLSSVPGCFRLRLGSIEPGEILFNVLDLTAESNGKICEFMHPSLQHGSDAILKAMNRHYLTGTYRDFVRRAREKVPHIHIGTDLIVGFPGETDELFEESYAFVKETGFSNMHIFPFSPREGTPAAKMFPRVSGTDTELRVSRLHELAETMKRTYHRSLVGSVQTMIPEECADGFGEGWTGNYVRCRVPLEGASGGDLLSVRITEMREDGLLLGERLT